MLMIFQNYENKIQNKTTLIYMYFSLRCHLNGSRETVQAEMQFESLKENTS